MKKLFKRQLAKATRPSGEVDLDALAALVVSVYEDADRDSRRADRSMSLMIEELGQVHTRLLDAFEAVPEGLVLFDAQDRFVLWNRRYAELHAGIFDKLAVGMRFEDVIRAAVAKGKYPEAVGREEEWLTDRLARHALPNNSHEYRLPGDRWIRVEERRTADGGSIGVRIDITDLKRREESFRLLFENNPVPMWVVDLGSYKFLAVNDAAIAHYGYTREQFLAMNMLDIRPPEDRKKFLQFIREGKVSQGDMTWQHKKADGTIIHVSVYARSLNYQGKLARLNAIVDVTERQNAENKLLEQKMQMDAALANMSHGLLMFDKDNRVLVINQRYVEMYQLPPDKAKPGCSLRDLLEQRATAGMFRGDIDQYIADHVTAGYHSTRLADLPDGRTILITNRPTENGGWVAVHEDITERRKAERAARRLFETSLDLILVTDRHGNFTQVSPSSEAILGYRPEEMVGRSAVDFVYHDDLESTRNEMRSARRGMHTRNFDTRYVHKDRRIIPLAWTGVWSEPEQRHFFIGRDMTERKKAEEKLKYLAHYDQLTGLPNRTTLQIELGKLIDLSRESPGQATSIAMFDLDGFKDINDTLGHSIGDQLLKEVAQRLTRIAENSARVYRLGGDEFVVTFPQCGDPRFVTKIVDAMLERLSGRFEIDGQLLYIHASVGIAIAPADGSNIDEVIANADLALYEAKASGGHRYRLFTPVLRARAQSRRQLDFELRRAFSNNEFELYFQPQLRVSDGAIVGAEALVRWRHPERGILGPGAFIEALGESPVVLEAGRWILRTACERAAAWRAMGLLPVRIGVNLFPAHFYAGTLLIDVEEALLQTGLPATALELEITENIALGHDDATLASMRVLREKGISLAFDDFGTGYASLSCLTRYPLSRIKIDQSFVRKITSDSEDTAIIRSIIAMAHNLGLEVVAEGVETPAQAAFLKAEGCDEVQGFLYARPLPIGEFEAFLRSRFAIPENGEPDLQVQSRRVSG